MRFPFHISFVIIVLIFFFNRVFLPFGLKYSLLLTPFFIFYLFNQNYIQKMVLPITILGIFGTIHLIIGVVIKDFIITTILVLSLLILLYTFFIFYKRSSHLEKIFERLTQLNFGLTIFAIISLITNKFTAVFWYFVPFTADYKVVPRLKLFELEASFYSFALLPLFFFYFFKVLKKVELKSFLLLMSLILSLILSFSLGVLAVIGIAIFLTIIVYLFQFIKFQNTRISLGVLGGVLVLFFVSLILFYPENPLFFRLNNLLTGADTSGRGRTYESFEIAWQVLQKNNPFFGIGLGQFKIIGRETLLNYYKFMGVPEVVRIPNAMAETLVLYGFIGVFLKLFFQLFFFVKLKVYRNVFQIALFFSLFIYQFTGSYIINEMEYILWIIALYPKFSQFTNSNYFKI